MRQRLARYYLETGDTQKARSIYDDAFAAASSPEDKMALIKPMAEAYFQDGQIDELIGRFKQQQSAEEGGWHYGQYLAQIYTEMDDFGSARRELAKSLSVRPQGHGAAALPRFTGGKRKNDPGELLHYRQQLAEIDPSATNEIALANEYATQNKAAEAWQVIQRNASEVAKDPIAWKGRVEQSHRRGLPGEGEGAAGGLHPREGRSVRGQLGVGAIPDGAGRSRRGEGDANAHHGDAASSRPRHPSRRRRARALRP